MFEHMTTELLNWVDPLPAKWLVKRNILSYNPSEDVTCAMPHFQTLVIIGYVNRRFMTTNRKLFYKAVMFGGMILLYRLYMYFTNPIGLHILILKMLFFSRLDCIFSDSQDENHLCVISWLQNLFPSLICLLRIEENKNTQKKISI